MRFYTQPHQYYCGIDLHARSMDLCILDQNGAIVLHRNMAAAPEPFLRALAPYRMDLVVAVECIFTGYWLADRCAKARNYLRTRACPGHEGHPWGQGQER